MIREIHHDRLFLGNAMDARDLQQLHDLQIAAVVDLAANEPPAQLTRDILYCRIPIIDGDGNSNAIIEFAIRSVATLVEKEFRTLVACSAGMSRSPAITATALSLVTKKPLCDTLAALFSGASHDVSPTLWSSVEMVYNEMIGN